jgi:alpha-L-arabinofuranosidase
MRFAAASVAGIAFAIVLAGNAVSAEETPRGAPSGMQVEVTAKELVTRPASPMICGNFIESGFGRQVEGMWAEMFFNRSFEAIPPYTRAHYGSRGCGPDTDVEKQPWWHSGYEEPTWELAPGNPKADWSMAEHVSFWKGQRAGWLKNESDAQWAGFAQRGIHLRKGERYTFSGRLRTGKHQWDRAPDDLSIDAEIRFYPDGDWSKAILTHTLKNIRKAFERQKWTFDNATFEGRATFSIWIPPRSNLGVDDLSLMPASNIHGWRAEVIEASKRANPKIIRWPGGCFASFYHWREGIGDRSEREPMASPFWGGLYDNDVGTPEFIQFCRLVGAEPFICVNVLTGDTDEAADWVAYCNAPATHPIGKLRKRDGHAEPFGVKYWELDNEASRRFSAAQYAQRCVEFARAMKAVDPTIEIAIIGYGWYRMSLAELLDVSGKHIDYVVDRAIDEPTLRGDLNVIRAYNGKHGTNIRLCNTEWPAPEHDVPPTVDRGELEKITTAKGRRRCWYSALNVAKTLLTFQRLGGEFAFSNFNNFANTWGQNVIECPKDAAYLSPAGHVFELFSRSPATWPLELRINGARENVVVQASWNEPRTALCLVVLNYSGEDVPVRFAFGQLDRRFTRCEMTAMRADSLTAYNSPNNPFVVERKDSHLTLTDSVGLSVTAPPFSLLHLVLE